MDGSEDELPLSIPVKAVSEHFTCPICMEKLTQTHITPCGHRYCGKCIRECINRRNKCPCCNTKVTANMLFSDWAFDNLISMVSTERNKAEDSYFERLIQDAGNQETLGTNDKEESPIVGTLQKHLKAALGTYEQYYRDLTRDFNQQVKEVEAKMEALNGARGDDGKMAHQLQGLEVKKQALQMELTACTQLLVEAYDKYLQAHMPSPSLLPVSISVRLHEKDITLPDIKVKPHSSLADIKEAVVMATEARGDPIARFNDDQVQYILLGPFEKGREVSGQLVEQLASTEDGERSEVIRLLPRGCHPVLEFGMKPGSEVVIIGSVKLASEMPKQCFAQTFIKDTGQTMDYFICKDCSFKWVCKSCKDFCHKDHSTQPYISAHQPTWACCYCPRKKKCQLVNQEAEERCTS